MDNGEGIDEIIGFKELKVGQRVKARGKLAEGNTFGALEINVKPPSEGLSHASIEGPLQGIDHHNQTLCILNRHVAWPSGAEVKILPSNGLERLQAGVMVKLKGKYFPQSGFLPEQMKVQETRSFNIEVLEGTIDSIDWEAKTLNVAGFTLTVNRKTMIVGFQPRARRFSSVMGVTAKEMPLPLVPAMEGGRKEEWPCQQEGHDEGINVG